MNFVVNICILFLPSLFFIALNYATDTPVQRSTYIIQMDKHSKPKKFINHKRWHRSTIEMVKSMNESFCPALLYSYENAIYGFSALLSLEELEILKKSHGFLSFYRDKSAKLLTTHTTKFMSLNPLTGLWPASKYGKNVIVGVIDSGIWPESDSFKDEGMVPNPSRWKGRCTNGKNFNTTMCNLKLIGARYYNTGLIASNPKIKIGMNSARDTLGHGTQNAQIIAGNYVSGASYFGYGLGKARGIAPRAKISMYKVGWEEGMYSSDILAGMNKAISDRVDIISISIDSETGFFENPIAIASFAAMEKNILVVASAGNLGPSLGTLVNGFPWVLTVAAGTIDRTFGGTLILGNGIILMGWTLFPHNAIIQDLPIIYNKTISACNSLELLSRTTGVIIVCDQSTNILDQIATITSSSNINAVIFVSDDPNLLEVGGMTCPGVVVSPQDAHIVVEYAKSSYMPRATIKFQQTILGTTPAPTVSHFSSRGPSPDIPHILKPDVMAPGTLILVASIPTLIVGQIGTDTMLENDFNLVSGTSVACPHVAGVGALLKGAHPEWSPAAIRSAIITTANSLDNTFQPITENGFPSKIASPFSIGAGQIDPNRALDPGLIYDANPQDYINFLCSMTFRTVQISKIIGSKNYECTNASLNLNYPSFIAFYSSRKASFKRIFHRTVTNVADDWVTYDAHITQPKGCIVTVSPMVLSFENKNRKQSYNLTIACLRDYMHMVSHGDLIWMEKKGQRRVRSPIVIALSNK